ncbi:unnamed protein product [Dimorphilus gyrociliatus]|uniref:Uncharacterized protein n=1 Tax=Dimorphilus gyrociliatus TaxID=2664684 RepID=A0A7I8VKC2_9ANNE|nr:unnamed protein product [Dimorphilus gyrociliatus]
MTSGTLMLDAVKSCRFKQVKFLARNGLAPTRDSLIAALRIEDGQRRLKMFRILLPKFRNYNDIEEESGRDVMTWACALGRRTEALLLLKEIGADTKLTLRDQNGRSPLHYACERGDVELTEAVACALQKYGLNADFEDSNGYTPYTLASRAGHNKCTDILIEKDQITRQNADESITTKRIQIEKMNKERKQKIIELKTFGRLPALVKAEFNINNVRIVPSKRERKTLEGFLIERPKSTSRELEAPKRKKANITLPSIRKNDRVIFDMMNLLTEQSYNTFRPPAKNVPDVNEVDETKEKDTPAYHRRSKVKNRRDRRSREEK